MYKYLTALFVATYKLRYNNIVLDESEENCGVKTRPPWWSVSWKITMLNKLWLFEKVFVTYAPRNCICGLYRSQSGVINNERKKVYLWKDN